MRVKLRDLVSLETNARYMNEGEYRQLVQNLKADGALTSVPLVAAAGKAPLTSAGKNNPEALEVLSGNHRVQAAIDAGIEEADVMEILTPVTVEKKIAIQLSHNAINGKDDPNVLQQLYADLNDLDLKKYTGLTDDDFNVDELDVASLGVGQPRYHELFILFLPEDEDVFVDQVKRFQESNKRPVRLVAHYDDFDRIFDAIVAVKKGLNVHNSAVALRAMADLAMERLEEIAEREDDSERKG